MKRVDRITASDGTVYFTFVCPGCGENHTLPVSGPRAWGFNGDWERPTFTPSILCRYRAFNEQTEQYDTVVSVCHSFVRNGEIQFLSDCSHGLKGRTVPLAEIP